MSWDWDFFGVLMAAAFIIGFVYQVLAGLRVDTSDPSAAFLAANAAGAFALATLFYVVKVNRDSSDSYVVMIPRYPSGSEETEG